MKMQISDPSVEQTLGGLEKGVNIHERELPYRGYRAIFLFL